MIVKKIFTNSYDAQGTSGFIYDKEGKDITPDATLKRMQAIYQVQRSEGGPWSDARCSVWLHRTGTDEEINRALDEYAPM